MMIIIVLQVWSPEAKKCRYPVDEMDRVIKSTLEHMDQVIDQVAAKLPSTFPDSVAGPILNGMKENRDRMMRSMD